MAEVSETELARLRTAAKELEDRKEQERIDEWNRVDARRLEADGGL